MLEKTFESPLDLKEIKPVNPNGNQPWVFIGRTDAEAEVSVFWSTDAKSWLTGKGLGPGKDWRQKEKGVADDEMVREHHQLNRHEFEQTLEDSGGQRNLACCSPWVHKELDMMQQPNNVTKEDGSNTEWNKDIGGNAGLEGRLWALFLEC